MILLTAMTDSDSELTGMPGSGLSRDPSRDPSHDPSRRTAASPRPPLPASIQGPTLVSSAGPQRWFYAPRLVNVVKVIKVVKVVKGVTLASGRAADSVCCFRSCLTCGQTGPKKSPVLCGGAGEVEIARFPALETATVRGGATGAK